MPLKRRTGRPARLPSLSGQIDPSAPTRSPGALAGSLVHPTLPGLAMRLHGSAPLRLRTRRPHSTLIEMRVEQERHGPAALYSASSNRVRQRLRLRWARRRLKARVTDAAPRLVSPGLVRVS
jgi:hypothetical protein